VFSVVIPLYNKASYLENAVKSVFNQTYKKIELIIVDDGSTDNGAEILFNTISILLSNNNFNSIDGISQNGFFSCNKINIQLPSGIDFKLISQPNQGVSSARNNGVAEAKYDYIAFLDADDWWEPEFLAEMKNLMESYPEALWYASNYYYVKHGIKRVDNKGIPAGFDRGYVDFIRTYANSFVVLVNCSFVVLQKKAFLELGGFPDGVRLGEDLLLWLRFAKLSSLGYVNRPLSNSFQDGEVAHRALGWKIYAPEEHFVFYLDELKNPSSHRPEWKHLIDGLKVRQLWKYRWAGAYPEAYQQAIATLSWEGQPQALIRYYTWPLVYLRAYWWIRKVGAYLKSLWKRRN
jgi:glycosyltransferase involved in cell wall biosynthesis